MNDQERIEQALTTLGEHWDSVLILCARPAEDGNIRMRSTDFTANYAGSLFSAIRQAQEYVIHHDEIARILARRKMDAQ